MTKQTRTTETQPEKKAQPKAEPAEASPGPAALPDGAVTAAGTVQTQADRLGDPRLQTAQRQGLATAIAQTQGNRHLRELLSRVSYDPNVVHRAVPVGPTTLSGTPAQAISPFSAADMRRFNRLLTAGNPQAVLEFVMQMMIRRGEVDPQLLTTQAMPGHREADCRNATLLSVNSSVNGANTISCGCTGTGGTRLPNPRIRVNFGSLQTEALTGHPPGQSFQEYLAALIHSTLFHEYRHVRQEFELCQGGAPRGAGVCTDCNDPAEMDAYLSEIEGGYNPHVYRHAWVRVYTNWNYLSPGQQAVFVTRRRAAEAKINRAFPGVNWASDAEVVSYQARAQQLDQQHGGQTRGQCNSRLAPSAGVPAPPPPLGDFPEPPEGIRSA